MEATVTWSPELTLKSYIPAHGFYSPAGHGCFSTDKLCPLQSNDYPWGPIMPSTPNTIADFDTAWSASDSDAWSSLEGNVQVPEDWLLRSLSGPTPSYGARTNVEQPLTNCYYNRSPLAVAIWSEKMESRCSDLQLDLTDNIKLCAPLAHGLCIRALIDPEGPTFRKPVIWTWPFLLKLVLVDQPLSIQEIMAEFSQRFAWCMESDSSWKVRQVIQRNV
ncbi:hypothetical protein R3P38DRAFT_3351375, partial [Favolaschia claudopus]